MSEPRIQHGIYTAREMEDLRAQYEHSLAELAQQLAACQQERDELKAEQAKYDEMRQGYMDAKNAEVATLRAERDAVLADAEGDDFVRRWRLKAEAAEAQLAALRTRLTQLVQDLQGHNGGEWSDAIELLLAGVEPYR